MSAEQSQGSKCIQVGPEIQEIFGEILEIYGSIENFEEHKKAQKKLHAFDWKGLDEKALEAKYINAEASVYQQIQPAWDLRRSALAIGDMAKKFCHETIPLYIATRESFLRNSRYGEAEIGLKEGQRIKFLRTIGHWERGDALTPPLLFVWGDKLANRDGHHRIIITLMSGVGVIPFYCADKFDFAGIQLATTEMHTEAFWRG